MAPILIKYDCKLTGIRLEKWLDGPGYEKADIQAYAKCYQEIQQLVKTVREK